MPTATFIGRLRSFSNCRFKSFRFQKCPAAFHPTPENGAKTFARSLSLFHFPLFFPLFEKVFRITGAYM